MADLYPLHADDSGPFMPLKGGGIICGKCHTIIKEPDFGVLRLARDAHAAAGLQPIEPPPPPETLTARHLGPDLQRALLTTKRGKGLSISEANARGLVTLGLIRESRAGFTVTSREVTEHGARVAAECLARPPKPQTLPMFDLGPPVGKARAR